MARKHAAATMRVIRKKYKAQADEAIRRKYADPAFKRWFKEQMRLRNARLGIAPRHIQAPAPLKTAWNPAANEYLIIDPRPSVEDLVFAKQIRHTLVQRYGARLAIRIISAFSGYDGEDEDLELIHAHRNELKKLLRFARIGR